MLDPALSGGGCMRNLGIHRVDAFLRFTQGETVEVLSAAITYRVHGKAIGEMGAALLRSESGVIGTIEAGYSYASMKPGGDFEGRLSSANCYISDRNDTLQVATLDDNDVRTLSIPDQGGRYDQFGRDTLERLRTGRPIWWSVAPRIYRTRRRMKRAPQCRQRQPLVHGLQPERDQTLGL